MQLEHEVEHCFLSMVVSKTKAKGGRQVRFWYLSLLFYIHLENIGMYHFLGNWIAGI